MIRDILQGGRTGGVAFWGRDVDPYPRIEQSLIRFQHKVVRRLTGRQKRRRGEGSWEYPLLAAAMGKAVFEEIGVYVTRRHNTVAQYITTRPILDLCEKSDQQPREWVSRRWWFLTEIYLFFSLQF